ncbi:MAG: class I SAM-dependent methyltransferase, partial [Polyangiales bacterium]
MSDDTLEIDRAKLDPRRKGWVKYVLRNAVVLQSPAGHLFTDYLDDEAISPEVDPTALTEVLRRFIADDLSSNEARVERHLDLVTRHVGTTGRRVLDVGCGGGLLLSRLRERGAEVEGTELNDSRVLYARNTHGLSVHK